MAKKSTFKPKQKKSDIAKQAAVAKRRKGLRDWGIIACVVLAVGFVGFSFFKSAWAEKDLTRIGQGTPMVIQVHDIHCTTCVTLQGQTKRAMKSFKSKELGYVIADLNTPEGGHYARMNGAGRTTLLLADSKGKIHNRVTAPTPPERLVEIFEEHLRRF